MNFDSRLDPENDFRIDPATLEASLDRDYDLVVLVNPNSPTGQHLPREVLESVLRRAPGRTRIWVDETYVDFNGKLLNLLGLT